MLRLYQRTVEQKKDSKMNQKQKNAQTDFQECHFSKKIQFFFR
jgi:hypothetical protein